MLKIFLLILKLRKINKFLIISYNYFNIRLQYKKMNINEFITI